MAYKIKKTGTQFRTLTSSGEVTNTMTINLEKIKSPDRMAYAFGYFQGKSGQPISKHKNLAPEYIRGYQDAKKGVKL